MPLVRFKGYFGNKKCTNKFKTDKPYGIVIWEDAVFYCCLKCYLSDSHLSDLNNQSYRTKYKQNTKQIQNTRKIR